MGLESQISAALPRAIQDGVHIAAKSQFGVLYGIVKPVVEPVLAALLRTPDAAVSALLTEFAVQDEDNRKLVEVASAVTGALSEDHWQLLRNQAHLLEEVALAKRSRQAQAVSLMRAGVTLMAAWSGRDDERAKRALLDVGLSGALTESLMAARKSAHGPSTARLIGVLDACVHPYVRLAYQLAFAALIQTDEQLAARVVELAAEFGFARLVPPLLEVGTSGTTDEKLDAIDAMLRILAREA